MRRIVVLLIVLVLLCFSSVLGEGKLKVTEKNLLVFPGDDSGYFYAKVENVGDEAVGVGSGDLVIFTEDDDILLSKSYVTTSPSHVVLEPNDYLYVYEFLWDSALKNAAIGEYKFSIPTRNSSMTFEKIDCDAIFELPGADSYDNYIYVTFTNTTDETINGFCVVAAMHDADGNLLFVDYNSYSTIGVHSGSTVTSQVYVKKDLMEYYELYGLVPTTVDAMVLYYNE